MYISIVYCTTVFMYKVISCTTCCVKAVQLTATRDANAHAMQPAEVYPTPTPACTKMVVVCVILPDGLERHARQEGPSTTSEEGRLPLACPSGPISWRYDHPRRSWSTAPACTCHAFHFCSALNSASNCNRSFSASARSRFSYW